MVIGLIKKAFGVEQASSAAGQKPEGADLVGFVKYVVTLLVDEPDKVEIKSEQKEDQLVIEVTCAKPDMGKVIGKRGKTIAAIRALVTSAGRRQDQKVNVEVID